MNFKGTFSVTITPTKSNGDINVKSLQNYFNWQIRKKIGVDVETKPEIINDENLAVSKEQKSIDKEITSTEETKKDEKKTVTQKAEGSQENLKDQK